MNVSPYKSPIGVQMTNLNKSTPMSERAQRMMKREHNQLATQNQQLTNEVMIVATQQRELEVQLLQSGRTHLREQIQTLGTRCEGLLARLDRVQGHQAQVINVRHQIQGLSDQIALRQDNLQELENALPDNLLQGLQAQEEQVEALAEQLPELRNQFPALEALVDNLEAAPRERTMRDTLVNVALFGIALIGGAATAAYVYHTQYKEYTGSV